MASCYQSRPPGAVGSWITKKSNSAFAGSLLTCTSICSTGLSGVIVTVAVALGKHAAAPAETTILNVIWACAPTAARGLAKTTSATAKKNSFFMVLCSLCDSNRGGLNPPRKTLTYRTCGTQTHQAQLSRGDDGGDREFISRLRRT